MRKLGYICAFAMFAVSMQAAIATKDLSVVKAEELGAVLAGAGIQISNVKFTGADGAAGRFTGGVAAGLGIEGGVILSSGSISNVSGAEHSVGSHDLPRQAGRRRPRRPHRAEDHERRDDPRVRFRRGVLELRD